MSKANHGRQCPRLHAPESGVTLSDGGQASIRRNTYFAPFRRRICAGTAGTVEPCPLLRGGGETQSVTGTSLARIAPQKRRPTAGYSLFRQPTREGFKLDAGPKSLLTNSTLKLDLGRRLPPRIRHRTPVFHCSERRPAHGRSSRTPSLTCQAYSGRGSTGTSVYSTPRAI